MDIRESRIFSTEYSHMISGKRVLDLGSAFGDMTKMVLDMGASSCIGIEKDLSCCVTSKVKYPTLEFVNIDVEGSDIDEYLKNADTVMLIGILYLLKDQDSFFNKISQYSNIKNVIVENAFSEEDIFLKGYHNILSENNLKNMFLSNGFKILGSNKYFLHINDNYMRNRILFFLER